MLLSRCDAGFIFLAVITSSYTCCSPGSTTALTNSPDGHPIHFLRLGFVRDVFEYVQLSGAYKSCFFSVLRQVARIAIHDVVGLVVDTRTLCTLHMTSFSASI